MTVLKREAELFDKNGNKANLSVVCADCYHLAHDWRELNPSSREPPGYRVKMRNPTISPLRHGIRHECSVWYRRDIALPSPCFMESVET